MYLTVLQENNSSLPVASQHSRVFRTPSRNSIGQVAEAIATAQAPGIRVIADLRLFCQLEHPRSLPRGYRRS